MDQLDDETVARLLVHLQSGAAVLRFFSRATSSIWIPPLREHGVFSSPVAAVRAEGSVTFPRWPQAEYLARVAEEAPGMVAETLDVIPETDNVWILRQLTSAIALMPWEIADRFIPRVVRWMAVPYAASLLLEPVTTLVLKSFSSGETAGVIPLLQAVFAVHEERPAQQVDGLADRSFHIPAQAGGRVASWEYRRCLEKIAPALAAADWGSAVDLLLLLLDRVLVIEHGEAAREAGQDASHIWYRALESPGELRGEGIADPLVWSLVTVSQATAKRSPEVVPALTERLVNCAWAVAWRVALHIAAQLDPVTADRSLLNSLLANEKFFAHIDMRREYNELLRVGFRLTDEATCELILGRIERRPRWIDEGDQDRLERWQRDRLAPIGGSLPSEWSKRYESLVARHGPPQFQDGLGGEATWWTGPTSPISATELAELDVHEVLEFVRRWRASGEWESPTPEGLGRVLAADVEKRASDYLAHVQEWDGLSATVSRCLIVGVTAAVRGGGVIVDHSVWDQVLRATRAGQVIDREQAPTQSEAMQGDDDPSWGWFRREAARLVEAAADHDAIGEVGNAGEAIEILAAAGDDQDPTPEDEARSGATMSPADLALNSTRGQAVHSTIALSSWLKRWVADADASALIDLLERQLNDRSPAVHSVFGMRFNQLAGSRWAWLQARIEAVFAPGSRGDAAWEAYVAWNTPWERLMPDLWPTYRQRVDHVADGEAGAAYLRHLMGVYLSGTPAAADRAEVLIRAWSKAIDEARAQCLFTLARWLGNDASEDDVTRARTFLEARLTVLAAERPSASREVSAMGSLLGTGCFAPSDVVAWIPVLVSINPSLDREPELFELLASFVDRNKVVVESVACTRLLFESDAARWASYSARGAIARIALGAMASGDSSERRAGEELRDYLLSTGRFELEWFTSPPAPD